MAEHQEISSKKLKLSSDNNGGDLENEDRLSSLPDSILADILSLLEIPSAVATSVLSHRWRRLWTQITRLHLDYFDLESLISLNFSKFFTIVDHILHQCSSPKINTFILFTPPPDFDDEFENLSFKIVSWISLVCGRNPEVLQVDLRYTDKYIVIDLSLNLELTGPFVCEFPDSSAINLPNLKELMLQSVCMTPDLMGTFIKSCPSLESLDLKLTLVENAVVINITAQNLKSLIVFLSISSKSCEFVIDAPKLQRVLLHGCFACYRFVNNRNTLLHATLGFDQSTFEVGSVFCSQLARLLQEISTVGSIHLLNGLVLFNSLNNGVANIWKTFRNLTRICLTYASLHQVNSDDSIFASLLAKVKWMEIYDLKGTENDLRLLKYILCKAEVLEEILVFGYIVEYFEGTNQDQAWRELEFCKKLFMLSRKSSICQIKFSGSLVYL